MYREFKGFVFLALVGLVGGVLTAQSADSLRVEPDTIIFVSLNTFLTTKNAQTGDSFHAEVAVPVTIGNQVAIPKSSIITGRVVNVKRSGRVKGRAEMSLAFEKIVFPDGFTSEISVELKGAHGRDFDRMKPGDEKVRGDTQKGKDVAIVAQTSAPGAIIGGVAGGGKGIGIGGAAGAVAGLVTVLATRGPDLILERGTQLDLVLKKPFTIDKAR